MNKLFNNLAIIQARTSSNRLPGKVLKEICGMPMILFQINRLKKSKNIDKLVLATSLNKEDDHLAQLVKQSGHEVFRGDLDDVLKRFYNCSRLYKSRNIIRLTGDCPLIDPFLVDEMIQNFVEMDWDYLSNCADPDNLSVPDGFDAEIFKSHVLENAFKNAILPSEREHVTPWFKTKKANLKWSHYIHQPKRKNYRVTVDEEDDLKVVRKIANYFFHKKKFFNVDDVVNFLKKNENIAEINSNIVRHEGFLKSKLIDKEFIEQKDNLRNSGQILWSKAKNVIPGGNMLLSKRPEIHLPGKWPVYFSKAKECYVWDLDNNKFVDLGLMGVGTNILGYGNPTVDDAVRNVITLGNMSTLNCPEEVWLAEKLVEIHEWAEMVRFARTTGEANSIAIRIARAATGREKIAICGFHVWNDWSLDTNLKSNDDLEDHVLSGIKTEGLPNYSEDNTIHFKYNNLEEIKEIISKNKLAAIKMEVQRNFSPKEGFLEAIRKICYEEGIVLIFDECTTGFRETFGGLHKKYNVQPDMAIFGKALGNGYSITSVIGKKNVMESFQDTFISNIFWTERIGPSAALKVLEIMEKEKSWERITQKGKYLRKNLEELSKRFYLNINFSGIPALINFSFKSKYSLQYKTLITQEMLKLGFLASTSCYLSLAHNKDILDSYIEALEKPFSIIARCEDGDSVYKYLDGPICNDNFKRFN